MKGGGHRDGEMETCSAMQATTNLTAQCEPALFHRPLVREKKKCVEWSADKMANEQTSERASLILASLYIVFLSGAQKKALI